MVEKVFDFIGKWIIVALGIIASLGAFINMFDVPIYMPVIVLLSIFFAGIFLAVSKLEKQYKVIFNVAILVIMAIVSFILRKQLLAGIYSVSNSVIDVYNEYFGGNVGYFDVKKVKTLTEARNYNTIIASAAIIIYSFIIVTATWYKVFASIHILLSLCFLLPGLVLGKVPNSLFMSMLVIYYMACFMYQHNKVIHPARLMVLIGVSVGIIGLIFLVCPPYAYDGENRYKNANEKLNKFAEKFSLDNLSKGNFESVFQGNGQQEQLANGGINGGRLGEADSVTYTGTVMLNVKMNGQTNHNLYLKGFVGTKYAGTQWITASDELVVSINEVYDEYAAYSKEEQGEIKEKIFSAGYDNYKSNIDKMMIVSYGYDATSYRYFPYYSNMTEEEDIQLYYAIRPEMKKTKTYTYHFADISETEMYQRFSIAKEDAKIYDYIKETNLEVNENLEYVFESIPGIEKDCYDETPESLRTCIEIVRNYLTENTEYSLNPGKSVYGDFVEDFLLYKKKGYCTAYASSAVLLLRYMGVPARYVEGYVIQQEDYKEIPGSSAISDYYSESISDNYNRGNDYVSVEIEVKDSSAHAWVEVYVPGLGFSPVEVTPGYLSGHAQPDRETVKHENDTSSNGELETTTNDRQETTREIETSSEITTDENGNTQSSGADGNAGSTGARSGEKQHTAIILIIVGIIILFVISLIIYKMAERKKKTNDYNTTDNRQNMMILIKIFEECLGKTQIEFSMNVNVSEVEEEITAKVDKAVQKIENKKNSGRHSDAEMIERLQSLKCVREVLELIYRYKYDSDNAEFTDEEVDSVRRYVERYRRDLKVMKR